MSAASVACCSSGVMQSSQITPRTSPSASTRTSQSIGRPPSSGSGFGRRQRDLDGLGDLTGWQYLAEGAIAMARILDSDGNIPTMPAAAKQLASLMATLHKEAAPKRGRLSAVQKMSASRPDAG
jgi:hypothetical protein